MSIKSFAKTTDLLHRALDAKMLRYNVSSNNLANAGVQGFKRTVINFESELKRALDSEKNAEGGFKMKTTHPAHIESGSVIDYKTVKPRRVLDYLTSMQANGSNVDPEQEAMDILKTQMQYQLLTQIAGFEYSQAQSVLK